MYTRARCISKFLAGPAISIKLLHALHTTEICIAWPCRWSANKKGPLRFALIGFPCSTVSPHDSTSFYSGIFTKLSKGENRDRLVLSSNLYHHLRLPWKAIGRIRDIFFFASSPSFTGRENLSSWNDFRPTRRPGLFRIYLANVDFIEGWIRWVEWNRAEEGKWFYLLGYWCFSLKYIFPFFLLLDCCTINFIFLILISSRLKISNDFENRLFEEDKLGKFKNLYGVRYLKRITIM